MLNLISRACIQLAVHAGSLYVTTTISVVLNFILILFQFAPEAGPTISLPNIIREGCQEDAYDMVNKNNNVDEKVWLKLKLLILDLFRARPRKVNLGLA